MNRPGMTKKTSGRNRKLANTSSFDVLLTRRLTLRSFIRSACSLQSRWAGISTMRARMICAL